MTEKQREYSYLNFLAILNLTVLVSASTVAYKIVQIGPFTATCSSLIFPVTFMLTGIISEVYGYDLSRRLLTETFFCGLVFAAIVNFCVYLPSPLDWHGQTSFFDVLGHTFRFSVAGTVGSIVGSHVNVFAVTRWKALLKGRYFILRILGASSIGQFFLVLITTFSAFLGMMPTEVVVRMFWFAFFSKIVYALVLLWPAALIVVLLKRHESVDVYDNLPKNI